MYIYTESNNTTHKIVTPHIQPLPKRIEENTHTHTAIQTPYTFTKARAMLINKLTNAHNERERCSRKSLQSAHANTFAAFEQRFQTHKTEAFRFGHPPSNRIVSTGIGIGIVIVMAANVPPRTNLSNYTIQPRRRRLLRRMTNSLVAILVSIKLLCYHKTPSCGRLWSGPATVCCEPVQVTFNQQHIADRTQYGQCV